MSRKGAGPSTPVLCAGIVTQPRCEWGAAKRDGRPRRRRAAGKRPTTGAAAARCAGGALHLEKWPVSRNRRFVL